MTQIKPTIFKALLFILKLTFFAFGGGNALMPMIKKEAVESKKWITEEEFEKILIITNSLPGPSIIQSISYMCIKWFGFWKGIFLTIFAMLPHVLFAFGMFFVINLLPQKYLITFATSVIVTIIFIICNFAFHYIKQNIKQMNLYLWIGILLFSILFNLFIPAPFNLPVLAILSVLLIYICYYFVSLKVKKGDK
ncbi:chromate transporter [Mycoplasmopsis gallinacea]|uniref:Chromate transporter n=1 Tax=Mycoplasmopsis gallinacea TaxID=29556 RepID=A0A6H0V1Y6_9BACT|nr:chromate transporter [Mycoplasmopsis gallinacea]QIW62212.1 chromate transporter [Mycoplasmopsis gallinacea]